MSKSKTPAQGPVDPDLVPPSAPEKREDESPGFERRELPLSGQQPAYEDEQAPKEAPPAEQPQEPEQAYAEDDAQQYAQDDPQQYDENGQPYAQDDQAYDENGQPYTQEPAYDDPAYDAAAQGYETSPMTGPPHLLQQHPMQQQPPMMQQPMMQQPMMQQPMPPLPPQAHPQQPYAQQPYAQQGPPSGPYRTGYDPNAFQPARGVPIPRPLLGSTLAVYGVLLWSFVIAGQFATSWISGAPMDQGTAAFIIFACTGAAWVVAARRSRAAMPTTTTAKFVGRCIGMGALAFGAFLVTLFIATLLGEASSGSGHDFLIAFLLVAIGGTAAGFGPRLTHPQRPTPTHGARFAVVLVWIAGAIATFVAGAELATSG